MALGLPRLVVHIGTHKTGSTAIQHALRNSARSLRKEGFLVLPRHPWMKEVKRATTANGKLCRVAAGQLSEAVEASRDQLGTFLLSYEGFSGDPYLAYSNASTAAETLRAATLDFDVRIIVFLRRQDHFLESVYVQSVKEGRSWAFADFVASLGLQPFDWKALLASFEESFSPHKVTALPYFEDHAQGAWSAVQSFGRAIGSESLETLLHEGARPNRGYGLVAVEIVRRCSPGLSQEASWVLRSTLESAANKVNLEALRLLSQSGRTELLQGHRISNELLALRWRTEGLDSWPLREQVVETRQSEPEESQRLDEIFDQVATIVSTLTTQVISERTAFSIARRVAGKLTRGMRKYRR